MMIVKNNYFWLKPTSEASFLANGDIIEILEVYNIKEGQKFRKRDKLNICFRCGHGAGYAPMSVWNAINAITEVETSTRNQTAAGAKRQFARGTFGAGAAISKRAFAVAADLVGVVQ